MKSSHLYTLEQINSMDVDNFVDCFAAVFEDSPWIARAAWQQAPFASFESLLEAMCAAVSEADTAEQLALLCAHPELGANVKMAEASVHEQTAAGIREAEAQKRRQLAELNAAYRAKFNFPFIIAVSGLSMDSILEAMQRRLQKSQASEFEECLQQVFKIARLRLYKLLQEN